MKKQFSVVVFACGFLLLASTAWAGKAEIEKKAKETKLALNFAGMAPGAALDLISSETKAKDPAQALKDAEARRKK